MELAVGPRPFCHSEALCKIVVGDGVRSSRQAAELSPAAAASCSPGAALWLGDVPAVGSPLLALSTKSSKSAGRHPAELRVVETNPRWASHRQEKVP